MSESDLNEILQQCSEINKMLHGLSKTLADKLIEQKK